MIRLRSISALLLLLLGCVSARAQAPNELQADLQQRLLGKMLTLRTPYAGEKLRFAADGAPVGDQQVGMRSFDGQLVVEGVQVETGAVVIRGARLILVYDQTTGGVGISDSKLPVEITTAVPSTSAQDFARVFSKLFFSVEELKRRECSAEQRLEFQDWIKARTKKKKSKTDVQAGTVSSPPLHCFPTGTPTYLVAEGVKPPKPISTPDPSYTDAARKNRVEGKATFAVVIDEKGLPSDALLLSSLDPGLNYEAIRALRNWRFNPATLNSQPVPVALKVEFNFWLR